MALRECAGEQAASEVQLGPCSTLGGCLFCNKPPSLTLTLLPSLQAVGESITAVDWLHQHCSVLF